MQLVSFAVNNYRSITKTSKLTIRGSITTLIGPNNEGKSNILRALVTVMRIVSQLSSHVVYRGRVRRFMSVQHFYRWDQDYPVSLQETTPNGESIFDLEFELTGPEVDAFRTEVGSSLNGTLPIRITVGAGEPSFKVMKQGPGGTKLSAKSGAIAEFIGQRLDFEYIPAIRPASAAKTVVEDIVARELSVLNKDASFRDAVRKIEDLQRPILDEISKSIRQTLKAFLPNVRGVRVTVPQEERYRALTRSCEVIVDDGTPTPLGQKGDGVQSLAALSLMRYASQRGAKDKQLILAIEEPESHLHPRAIHQLRGVLTEIAKEHQIIITTHCPLFVERREIAANIIVADNKAIEAETIQEIRDILGVRISDNLRYAEVVLVVEGENDRVALSALLAIHSPTLQSAIQNGYLVLDSLLGGSNLSYKLSQIRDAMCTPHCFLDKDQAGLAAAQRAEKEGLATPAEITYATCQGMKESEIEDFYDPALYAPMVLKDYGVSLESAAFKNAKQKWSKRMQDTFAQQGKVWDDKTQERAKFKIAQLVSDTPEVALLQARRGPFDALAAELEVKIAKAVKNVT